MKNNILNFLFVLIAITFLLKLPQFLSSGNPSYLVTGSIGIILLISIFSPKYFNFDELFSHILIGAILFSGLILSYTYLFESTYVSSAEFFYAIAAFLMYILFFVYYYMRGKDRESPESEHDNS